MIRYRPFRNTDPPALVEIWRSQPPLRRRAQGISVMTLERFVFSKPYFEHEGLIVAEQDGRPLGYAHAGFGPSADGATLSAERGVVAMLAVLPDSDAEVGGELLLRCEEFLLRRGATEVLGGEHGQLHPFYLGLYGGGHPAGVLESDPARETFLRHGYEQDQQIAVLQRSLAAFRPAVDRKLMQIRRSCHIEATLDPPSSNWWDACTLGATDRTEFVLLRKGAGPCARALFSEMEPLSNSWGVRACGLHQLEVFDDGDDTPDVAAYLLGESLRQLQGQGVSQVETHLLDGQDDSVFQRLGFETVDTGATFRKSGEL